MGDLAVALWAAAKAAFWIAVGVATIFALAQ